MLKTIDCVRDTGLFRRSSHPIRSYLTRRVVKHERFFFTVSFLTSVRAHVAVVIYLCLHPLSEG